MNELNYLAIFVAAVAALVVSSLWYMVFASRGPLGESPGSTVDMNRPPVWKLLVELVRSLVVAVVLAGLAEQLGIVDWPGAVQLGFAMWIGFPVVLLVGSVIWENVPWRLGTIHAGDWLVKTLLIAVIVTVWQ
jgi:hypothetical protein